MKLVELVARNYKSWPEHIDIFTQDITGKIWGYKSHNPVFERETGFWRSSLNGGGGFTCSYRREELADDYQTAKVTKGMWEAEIAKSHTVCKSMLRNGMRVKLRSGSFYIVLDDTLRSIDGYLFLSNYNDDLTAKSGNEKFDVVTVYEDFTENCNPTAVGNCIGDINFISPKMKRVKELQALIRVAQEELKSLEEESTE